jgi:hypothetical protein
MANYKKLEHKFTSQKQLNAVMDLLRIEDPKKRECISQIIINGEPALTTEKKLGLKEFTMRRVAKQCADKWEDMLKNMNTVLKLGRIKN